MSRNVERFQLLHTTDKPWNNRSKGELFEPVSMRPYRPEFILIAT